MSGSRVSDPQASRTQAARAVFGLGRGANTHSRDIVDNTMLGALVGRIRTTVVLGVDEEAESPALFGMTTQDTILGVVVFDKTDDDTVLSRVRSRDPGDFTAGADSIVPAANKEDTTDSFYIVTWLDAVA